MTAAASVPEGFSGVTPYICVRDAKAAIAFYMEAFGAVENFRIETGGSIGHAEMTIYGAKIMMSDPWAECGILGPDALGGTPVTLHLYVDDVDAVVSRAVEAGATLERPVEDQFYGDRSGMLIDPFGHRWCFATHIEHIEPEELQRRARELFGAEAPEAT